MILSLKNTRFVAQFSPQPRMQCWKVWQNFWWLRQLYVFHLPVLLLIIKISQSARENSLSYCKIALLRLCLIDWHKFLKNSITRMHSSWHYIFLQRVTWIAIILFSILIQSKYLIDDNPTECKLIFVSFLGFRERYNLKSGKKSFMLEAIDWHKHKAKNQK